MQHCDSLITPRWCAPVTPENTVLCDHSVIVSDGRITDVLPSTEARQKYQPSVTVEKPDHILIPGLVNAHTHAAMTLMRGMADDLPLADWLRQGIWPVEKRWMSPEMVRDGTELAIAEMIRGGTTCFSDQYFFPEIIAETAMDHNMRAMIGTPVVEFPTAWANDASEYLTKANDLVHDPYRSHPLVSTCFAPHSTATVSGESFLQLRVLADQLEVPVQIHLHEAQSDIVESVTNTGRRPFDCLQEAGLVNSSLLAVHCVYLNDSEIDAFKVAGVNIAHCPRSNLKLASGIAPITKYRAAGLNVALGTDGAASNNALDMLSEMRYASLLAKGESLEATALSANEALRMATLDSATALGLAHEIGTIEAGKWADLVTIDLNRLHSQPVYDPVSQLVYTARSDQVTDVWIAGKHQLENGELTHIDIGSVLQRSNEWRNRIMTTKT